ncbi:unnamed protein product [Urochloa decumbens]|uniref:Cytochrome P450 n=1 Tax=Urochloa decumbens TaxID=240449 RepID=A0ABC9FVZ8_9POAL
METTATASTTTVTTPSSLRLPHVVIASCAAHANALYLLVLALAVAIPCALLLLDAILGKKKEKKKSLAKQPHRRLLLPPSPRGLPLVGNLHQLGRLPHRSLRALAAAHGPVMLLRLGRVPALVVSSPAAAREVMREQDHVFATRPSLAVPRTLLYGCTDIAFAPHGPYWRAARKAAVRHLLGPSSRERRRDGGGVVCLSELLSGFAKDGGSGWRGKVGALLDESNALLGAFFHAGDFLPWLSWLRAVDGTDARVATAFARIDGILEEILDDAGRQLETGVHDDHAAAFVHVLLSLHKESESAGSPAAATEWRLSRDNVKALLEDLFGAGTEATIIVLEWAMAELLRDRGAMEKLQHEVRGVAGGGAGNGNDSLLVITEEDLPAMEYLRAVIKETMRLHTPGPLLIPRECMEDTRVGCHDVPRGAMVIVNAWAIGRDPAAWEEAPEEFRPERFAGGGGSAAEVDFRGRHFQLIPFGAGRRMCPGVGLAMSVVELALANLVARFDWALPEGEGEKDIDMEEAPGCTSRKRAPLRAVATRSCPVPSQSKFNVAGGAPRTYMTCTNTCDAVSVSKCKLDKLNYS